MEFWYSYGPGLFTGYMRPSVDVAGVCAGAWPLPSWWKGKHPRGRGFEGCPFLPVSFLNMYARLNIGDGEFT